MKTQWNIKMVDYMSKDMVEYKEWWTTCLETGWYINTVDYMSFVWRHSGT